MAEILLSLVVVIPLAASVILFLSAGRLSGFLIGAIACSAISLSAIFSAILAGLLHSQLSPSLHVFFWEWMRTADFSTGIGFTLDPLSLVMILIVTWIGLLIHFYATRYMAGDPGLARFFGCMTLFVASMLLLVLSSDLLCMFIGWEGVGLCSYLLIGFWYTEPANLAAARKAFIITRVGDAAMLCGLLLLATEASSLQVDTLLQTVTAAKISQSALTFSTLLILVGTLAKSAQLPFQSWLPDAMAGPTPTSALIHAATMVTAGIYLIARLHVLFTATPLVLTIMAVVGTLTLFLAACNALVQSDLKRILAWSTVSQLGYMFLALGTGLWQIALFHLMTHAFFKALLFLCAGAIITRVHHEQNIFRMGGLFRTMPGIALAFLAGATSLAGFPLLTAGFYSKELILSSVWNANFFLAPDLILSGHVFWVVALAGAFLTSLYISRCFLLVFMGKAKTHESGQTPLLMAIPLGCLSFLALFGGMMEMPDALAHVHLFTEMVDPAHALPSADEPLWLLLVGGGMPVLGALLAWIFWGQRNPVLHGTSDETAPPQTSQPVPTLAACLLPLFRIPNWLGRYDFPARLSKGVSILINGMNTFALQFRACILMYVSHQTLMTLRQGNLLMAYIQNGRVRWYAAWIAGGLCASLALAGLT
ncbi:NADH-quinone oxidoreductase subunit L [Gluconobacter thailandicus]|uniref:NADH-quinone oxidoreductase subunit L n=1 Tax=Gluconobacter thailandicus TaxID=257438 RepID=UPI000777EAE5|nr:NADH-quinone oxidoreductase subunit L [Gluconobacter thailandicus]KXV35473.1 NADH-quinone oxidoreductase subunit L [Gluconobacter thailandicus]